MVEQGEELLAPGAGGGDDADRSRAKPCWRSRDRDRRRPRCRSRVPSRAGPAARAVRLSTSSCSSGTLSLKIITSLPASSASIASTNALAPGTETRTRPSGARRSALAVVLGGATSLGPSSRRFASSRARSTPASASSSVAGSASRSATTRSLVVASPGTSKPISVSTSMFRPVAMATWAASTPSRSCTARLTWSRVTESAYAPGRSSTCRNPSPLTRAPRPTAHISAAAQRAPSSSPEPVECPTASRSLSAPACAGVPSAPTYAANCGSTSPCSAQSSRVADSKVVCCIRMRTASSTTGVGTPAARCMASQPQSTSSPRGVRPSPAPTRRVDGLGVQRGHGLRLVGCVHQAQGRHPHPRAASRSRAGLRRGAARRPTDVRRTGPERRPGRPCGCRARRAPGRRAGRRPRHTSRPRRDTPRARRGGRPGPVPSGASSSRSRTRGGALTGITSPTLVRRPRWSAPKESV